MLNRINLNQNILDETLGLLKYDDPSGLIKAFLNTCYLVEQAIKKNIRDKNPLLYYDSRCLNEPQNKVAAFLDKPSCNIKSVDLNQAIEIFIELNPTYQNLSALFKELRKARNEIIHSTNTTIETPFLYADLTAKILIALMEFIKEACDLNYANVIVETKKDLIKRQKELLKKAKKELRNEIAKHQRIYQSLEQSEVVVRLKEKKVFDDKNTFVSSDQPVKCPACGENSLDEITMVDFEYEEGEINTYGGSFFQCRVCKIELNQSELDLM